MSRIFSIVLLCLLAIPVFAQNPVTADSPFQVRYAANLNLNDSYIDITNTGANGASLYGPGVGTPSGNICVNVYAFDPGEEEIACCSCLVTPNALVSMSVKNSILNNTETAVRPNSVVIKLISTLAGTGGTGTSCSGSAANASTSGTLATGLGAWMTTTHAITTTTQSQYWWVPATTTTTATLEETPFLPSTLSAAELASAAGRCKSIVGNGSGAGICGGCQVGGQ